MRNLDIASLRTLLHVVDAASMTVAARRLHLTQGTVSQQIQRLEQVLGHALLVRGNTGVRLTAEGERLLPLAQKLVDLNDAMVDAMRAPDVAGPVTLGVPHDLMLTHVAPLLQAFAARFPLVKIELVAGSSIELKRVFDAGTVDLAITEETADTASGMPLFLETPVWVRQAGGQAWRRRPLPVCLVSATCVFGPHVNAALAGGGIAWRNAIDYPSLDATVATVQADLAVTVLLPSTVPDHLTVMDAAFGLPVLPPFAVTLHTPAHYASAGCRALAASLLGAYGHDAVFPAQPIRPSPLRRQGSNLHALSTGDGIGSLPSQG